MKTIQTLMNKRRKETRMIYCKLTRLWAAIIIFLLPLIFSGIGHAQEINLDKMKKAGDLICYPSLKDPSVWYYLPDQPRLAMKNGKPQFSFMKYSRTSKQGVAGTNEAQGGGIVHFLVTYGVGKDQVDAAQRTLQEENPDARIQGPIVYRKGNFALITSFQEARQTLVKTVAVGKAPLMEGQKAAVSIALTRTGAELLWESFKSDTPDISLVFDMEFAGIREPYEATIEADWSRVSKHKRLKAGVKYSWFGADVDILFQELRQSGAIKITTKGENAAMDKIVQSAHAKLLQVMFDPAPVDDLSKAAAEKDSYSNLNQAMKLLKDSKKTSGKSTLNLGSPGFRQMIAWILEAMVPEAHASTGRKLTEEERSGLSKKFLQAKELYAAENYEQAIELFQECDQIHRNITGSPSPGGNIDYAVGHCLLELARYQDAANHFKTAADRWGHETKDGKAALANAQKAEELAKKNNQIALKTSKKLSESQLEDLRNIFRRGIKLKEQGKYQEALEAFKECMQKYRDLAGEEMPSIATRYNIAVCLMQLKQYREAAKYYRQTAQRAGPETADGKKWLQEAQHAEELADRGSPTAVHKDDTVSSRAHDTRQSSSDAYNAARRLDEKARKSGYKHEQTQQAIKAYKEYQQTHSPTGARAKETEGRLRSLNKRLSSVKKESDTADKDKGAVAKALSKDTSSSTSTSSKPGPPSKKGKEPKASSAASPFGSRMEPGKKTSSSGSQKTTPAAKKSSPSKTASRVAEKKPSFSLVASYQMKNIKRSGKMSYQMNHFRSESQSFTMAENIGSLYSRYKNDNRVFRAVTIDDPVFKQREILVTLDGQDASTFTKYLNFVTLKMKKQHQSGEYTTDEVVITPELFNASSNSFSLNYGYKGDTDRNRWLDYQYQTVWSFHGGVEVRSSWKTDSAPMLSLLPPHRYREVTIEGEGTELQNAKVRHAVITIRTMVNGKQITTQTTIKNQGPAPALHLDVPEGVSGEQGDVLIKWFLRGGKKIESPIQKLEGDIIYWDELPQDGRI